MESNIGKCLFILLGILKNCIVLRVLSCGLLRHYPAPIWIAHWTGQNNQIALHCVHVCAQLLARTRWSPSEYLFLGHIDGFSVSSHLRMLSYNEILFRIVTNTIQIDKFWCTDTTEGSARERQTSKNRKSMQTQGKLLFITDSIFWRNSNFGVF